MSDMFTTISEWVSNGVENLRVAVEGAPLLFGIADLPYLFRPFVLLLILGVVAGIVGALVNLRSLEFSAEAMVHSIFPGIVGGFVFLGGISGIMPGALIVAVFVTLALTILSQTMVTMETATAVVLTAFFGLGIVMVTYYRDMSGQLEALLFGRLLEVTDADLAPSIFVCLIALTVVLITWRKQVARAFDPVGVSAQGVSLFWLDILLNFAVGLVVVAAATAVGALLVIGYLIVPGAAGRLIARSTSMMTLVSVIVGVTGSYLGMIAIATLDSHPVSPQAAAIIALVLLYLLLIMIRPLLYHFWPEVREHATIKQVSPHTSATNEHPHSAPATTLQQEVTP